MSNGANKGGGIGNRLGPKERGLLHKSNQIVRRSLKRQQKLLALRAVLVSLAPITICKNKVTLSFNPGDSLSNPWRTQEDLRWDNHTELLVNVKPHGPSADFASAKAQLAEAIVVALTARRELADHRICYIFHRIIHI